MRHVDCMIAMWTTGLWVVLPGSYLKLVETLNTDFDMRVHNWEQQGKKGSRPRHVSSHLRTDDSSVTNMVDAWSVPSNMHR